ncbi:MAG: hypothetical protein ABRQ27_01180 [Clostridiaceae bacterium]
MKKLFTLLMTIALVASMSVTAFAATKNDIITALKNAGVPSVYVTKAQNYLKTHEVTDAQTATVVAEINHVMDLMKKENTTDLTKLSLSTKTEIMQSIKDAAAALGLTASFDRNASNKYVLTLRDADGNILLQTTAAEVKMKKTGSDSYVLLAGTVMIILAGTSLVIARRKVRTVTA